MKKMCDCEYHTHTSGLMSRRDDKTHQYGAKVEESDLRVVNTIHGPYNICSACQKDHPIPPEYLKPTLPEGSPHSIEAGRE